MDTATFATKADLAELRGDLKASIAELRADIHQTDSQHKTWILATVLSVLGTGIAMAAFIVTNLKPQQQAMAQSSPPIVINVPPAVQVPPQPADAKPR